MRFSDYMVPKTIRDLRDCINSLAILGSDRDRYTDYGPDFDGYYHCIELAFNNLRRRLGDSKVDQLIDMLMQAKEHQLADDAYGSRLLQDVERVLVDRPPFAYPKRLYRWARPSEEPDPGSTPMSVEFLTVHQVLSELLENDLEWSHLDFSTDRSRAINLIAQSRTQLGGKLTDMFLEMMATVEEDYSAGEGGYGRSLLVDMRRILCGLSAPWHYPRERWVWPKFKKVKRDPGSNPG